MTFPGGLMRVRQMRARGGPKAGRRAITLVDQGLSSVSNILAVVLVARVLSPDDFGRFSLGYAVLTLALLLSRMYLGTRISLAADPATARRLTEELVAGLLIVSPVLIAVVFAVSALLSSGRSLPMLLIIAIATPVVCLQDLIRFGAAASGRPWAAVTSDGTWVLLMLVPFLLGLSLSAAAALALWFAAALAALAVAVGHYRLRPRPRAGWARLRSREPVGESLTLSALLVQVAVLWILALATRVISPAAAGALRGASTSMGPVNVLFAFSQLGLTSALVRRPRSADLQFSARCGLAMAAVTAVWGTALLLLPDPLGTAAFGQSWAGIRAVLPWTVLEYLALCAAAGAILGLKVRRRARDLLAQRAGAAAFTLLVGTAVALVTGRAWCVAAALAGSALISAGTGWLHLWRSPLPVATAAPLVSRAVQR